jgi:hypothetical protein
VESVAEFDDSDLSAQREFERLWDSDLAVPFPQFDLASYAVKRHDILRQIPRQIAEQLALPSELPNSDILKAEWVSYTHELHQIQPQIGRGLDINKWLFVLDERDKFLKRDWESDLDRDDLSMMYGKGSYAPFGQLNPINEGKFLGAEGAQRRRSIGRALNEVMRMKLFEEALIQKVFENLLAIDGCGPALATRLLTLARPDWFVVVNRRSFRGLATRFQLPINRDLKPKLYAELLGKIQSQPWCQSQEPAVTEERKFWEYRVALIDPLVYEGDNPAVFGRASSNYDDLPV